MSVKVFNVLTDVYKTLKSGEQKLIKRNVTYKKSFEIIGMTVEHYLNSKGEPSKRWCLVKPIDSNDYFRLKHSYEEIEKLIKPIYIKGYKRW